MYLRTPKRYRRGQKRSPISLRWLWLWLLTPLIVFGGVELVNRRDQLAGPIEAALSGVLDSAGQSLATAAAPPPTATADPTERLNRAAADWRDGRIEAAVAIYREAAPATPNSLEVHYRLALGLAMAGQLESALDAAERAITADPFSADGWAIRAMVLDWSGRYGEAIASALRALEITPRSARALAFMAEAYKDLGQTDLALETIRRALEIDPESFEALRVRGLIAWELEFNFEAARNYFQQAVDLAPNLPYLAVDLAQISYFAFQETEEAIGLLRDVVELNPQNTPALFELGRIYYSGLGSFSQASDYLERCVQANPRSIPCQGLLGRVQMSLDQYPQAAESLQRAIDLGSANPRHYLWAGRTQIALGSCGTAIPLLQKSVELAQRSGDSEAATAAQDNLRECSAALPLSEPLPEPTAEAETGAG